MEQFSSLILFFIVSFLILIFVLPFLYINTLQNTIKATNQKNRTIEPYEVWLYFIPILGLFFHFGHIMKITTTLKNDFEDKKINHNNESLFGANIGLTYSLINIGFFCYFIYCISILPTYNYSEIRYLFDDNDISSLLIIKGLLLLTSFILLIIFWSKMSNCKRILLSMNNGNNSYDANIRFNRNNYSETKNYQKTCRKCGLDTLLDDKFCMECGSSDFKSDYIDEKKEEIIIGRNEKECPSCNYIIDRNSEICNFCDYDFNTNNIKNSNESHNQHIESGNNRMKVFIFILVLLFISFITWYFTESHSGNRIKQINEISPKEESVIIPADTLNIKKDMSHEDMTNTSNDSLDIQIEHNNLPKDFSTQSVQDFINQYYQDICNDNLNVDSYYSPNVNQFITLKNITSDEVAYQINTVAKREFRNTKTKIISDVEQINKDSKNGISYYTFSISLETYRVSKKKNTACNVDIEIGLNPDFKMVSYKELKYYDYKSY